MPRRLLAVGTAFQGARAVLADCYERETPKVLSLTVRLDYRLLGISAVSRVGS